MTKEELADLRRKAYAASDAHDADMKNDPEYAKAANRLEKARERAAKRMVDDLFGKDFK